ncbi:MAG: ACT domain-containing protein [Alphaproteobacteria bacterium]|nr:ACT domain-containing protein [Alphaproteobacteria bacterium]
MSGERNLQHLLAGMDPILDPDHYIFASVSKGDALSADLLMRFQEVEGDTVILTVQNAAQEGLSGEPFRRITLSVHSALEAVGLTAAFSACLKDHGISANVVAGYYHDHIFVPDADADRALRALQALSMASKA